MAQRLKVYFCKLAPREMLHPNTNSAAAPMSQTFVQAGENPGSG